MTEQTLAVFTSAVPHRLEWLRLRRACCYSSAHGAKARALQSGTILSEERLRPTSMYVDKGVDWSSEIQRLAAQLKAGEILKQEALAVAADGSRRLNIMGVRAQDPRTVSETPDQYEFVSANYGFLLKLMNQIEKVDLPAFVTAIISRTLTHGITSTAARNITTRIWTEKSRNCR